MSDLLSDNKVLWAGVELVEGTNPGLTDANCISVQDLDVQTPNDTQAKETSRGFLGAQKQQITNRRTEISFNACMAGSDAAGTPPDYGVLLRGVGFEETINAGTDVQYCPISGAFETLSLQAFMDRNLHEANAARGSWGLTLPSGNFPLWNFNFIGDFVDPTDNLAAALCTLGAIADPVIGDSDNVPILTIGDGLGGTIDLCASEVSLDSGNDINRRQLYNCESTSLTGRAITGSITIDAFALNDYDPYDVWGSATEVPLTVQHGTTPGNIVLLEAPALQILGISYGDDNGCLQWTFDFQMNPVIGNDEFCITLS